MKPFNLEEAKITERKTGWINIYGGYSNFRVRQAFIYPTKEKALEEAEPDVVCTTKIEWEE